MPVFGEFDLENYDLQCIEWVDYSKSESLAEYAALLMAQVDTTEPFALGGVSMGGMLAIEMAKIKEPEFLTLISSAESVDEVHGFYQLGRWIPLHHLNNDFFLNLYLKTPPALRGVHESSNRKLYIDMISITGARFMNWQIDKILSWEGSSEGLACAIHRIQGEKDSIIPVSKNASYDRIEKGCSHKMVINRPELICNWLDSLLS